MHSPSSSSAPSSSSLSLIVFTRQLQQYKWLIIATLVNYITYSSWTLLNKYQFSPPLSSSITNNNNHNHEDDDQITSNHHAAAAVGLGTDCPIFSTGLQMLLAGLIACSVSILINQNGKVLLNNNYSTQSSSNINSGDSNNNSIINLLKYQILPLGIARAIDIGCGNAALALISVALQQILKSLLPLFVCLLSYFVLGKKFSTSVWLSLIPIVFGSLLSALPASSTHNTKNDHHHIDDHHTGPSSSSQHYHHLLFGVCLALVSTIGRSLKAVLNAKLLSGGGAGTSMMKSIQQQQQQVVATAPLAPLEVLSLEAPTSGLILIALSCVASFANHFLVSNNNTTPTSTIHINNIITSPTPICNAADSFSFIRVNVFAGILMFFNQLSYITVIKLSSALSCQVLMNLKMSLLIIVSIILFATPLSGANVVGMMIAFCGCLYYAAVAAEDERKRTKMMKDSQSSISSDAAHTEGGNLFVAAGGVKV